jgi:hypothetical protein
MARKERLFSKIPAHPTRQVNIPIAAAMVEVMSSVLFATRMMSALAQTLNQVRRHAISPTKEYIVSYRFVRK